MPDSAEERGPRPEEVGHLSQFCAKFGIPEVPVYQEVTICMGMMPLQLPSTAGVPIQVFTNQQMGYVLKFAHSLDMFRCLLVQAYVMKLLASKRGFQRMVGVFVETMCVVSRDAGQTMDRFPLAETTMATRRSLVKQVCDGLQILHDNGLAYNNLTARHVCLKKTDEGGVKVTLIALGRTLPEGALPRLPLRWNEDLPYAPEICGKKDPGPCGKKSDIYSLAKLLSQVFCVERASLRDWISKGLDMRPSERLSLAKLVKALLKRQEEERRGRRDEGRRAEAN